MAPPPAQLPAGVRRHLRLYFTVQALVLTCFLAVVALALAFLWTANQTYVWILLGLCLLMWAFAESFHRSRTAKVVWIRRFGRGAVTSNEQAFLETAVHPWGTLITLADGEAGNSATARGGMPVYWFFAALLAGAIVWKLLGGKIATGVITALAGGFGAVERITQGTTLVLDESNWHAEVDRLLTRRRLHAGAVVQCPVEGELWRTVVGNILSQADCVLISAPERSPALHWEIETARALVSPAKILFVDLPGAYPPNAATLTVPDRWPFYFALPSRLRMRQAHAASTLIGKAIRS